MNNTMNVTMGLSGMASYSSIGWIVGIAVFLGIILLTFLLSKNFRKFIYGIPVTLGLLITYWISKSIGTSASEGNFESFKWFCYIVVFIIISIITGYFLGKTKKVKQWEKEFENGK